MSALVRQIKAGTIDVSVVIRIVDSTDGSPETAVVFNTGGIDLQYRRELAASVAITEATLAALTTAHADGGFLHIGNGYYRLDLPDAACAAGATGVLVHGTVTGMVVIGCYVDLVAYNPYDTVRLGLTALPNAAAEAAGGLYTRGTGAGQINQDANGRVDTRIAAITSAIIVAGSFAAGAFAAVKTLVVEALATDTYAEPGQGAPAATTTLAAKLNYVYKLLRNKKDNDGTTTKFYADDTTTVDHKQTTSSAAGTVTKGEIVSGP